MLIPCRCSSGHTPNPPINIVDFTGFDSNIVLIEKGGILMSIGNLPESLSQAMLVGTILVGGLGVVTPESVNSTLLLVEPRPCTAAAETALQPPSWLVKQMVMVL